MAVAELDESGQRQKEQRAIITSLSWRAFTNRQPLVRAGDAERAQSRVLQVRANLIIGGYCIAMVPLGGFADLAESQG